MITKVAIQGQEASFHDVAAARFFGGMYERISCDSFKETFAVLASGQADFAVCAIENSLYGSINDNYDLLMKHKLTIVGEVYLRIEQCLIGLPNAQLSDIKEVYSHPVALAQCEDYLDESLPQVIREEAHDTAGSVALIKANNNKSAAAIASQAAAALHGMQVLAEGIETSKQNYTRFWVLANSPQQPEAANKTSLVLDATHAAGALYRALGAFAENDINLTKLQSRPIVGKAWHYVFYIDVEASTDDQKLIAALDLLRQQGCRVETLGSYQAGAKV